MGMKPVVMRWRPFRNLGFRFEHLGRSGLIEAGIAQATDNADDAARLVSKGGPHDAADEDLLADGVPLGEILAGESLVNDDNRGGLRRVLV